MMTVDVDNQVEDEKATIWHSERSCKKYQPYHQAKLRSMNILLVNKPSNQKQIIEQAKFTDSPLGKAFRKQIKTIKDQDKNKLIF